jgi:hypothetical protein
MGRAMPPKPYDALYLHCSASEFGSVIMIDGWHRQKGWKKVGYGAVVQNGYPGPSYFKNKTLVPYLEGAIEIGRLIDDDDQFEEWEKQAGIYGHNSASYHVCMIGEKSFSNKVRNSALVVARFRTEQLKIDFNNVKGHCEMDPKKPFCPGIDMIEFRKMLTDGKNYGQKTIVVPEKTEEPKKELSVRSMVRFLKSFLKGLRP